MRRSALLIVVVFAMTCPAKAFAQSSPFGDPTTDWPIAESLAVPSHSAVSQPQAAGNPKFVTPSTSAWNRRPYALELHGAPFGSPIGHYGLTIDYSIFKFLSASAGIGQGGAGPQGALGARLRLPLSDNWALGYANAVSGGRHDAFCYECGERSDFAIWNTHELSAEYRHDDGFLVRLNFGMSFALNPGSFRSRIPASESNPDPGHSVDPLPVVSLAVGYSF